jgi:fermentation-respiration switch protein FrsA (DUF1100 family)
MAGEGTEGMNTNKVGAWWDKAEVLAVAFHPRAEPGGLPPRGFQEFLVPVDGAKVGARFYSAGTNAPTLLFFHGNGEIVADYDDLAPIYTREIGVNFLAADYRGYGQSTGSPTLTSMIEDASVVFEFSGKWLKERGYKGSMIVMGRSIGSASALELASAYPSEVKALILDSGFAHPVELLNRLGARINKALLSEIPPLDQVGKMAKYTGPVLIIHGDADQIIPFRDAEDLLAACRSTSKKLFRIRGAGHNNLMAVDLGGYMSAIAELVAATP